MDQLFLGEAPEAENMEAPQFANEEQCIFRPS